MKKTTTTKHSALIKYLVIAAVALVGVYLLKQKLMQRAQVALVVTSGSSCMSLLTQFDVATPCSDTGFKSYTYTCKNGKPVQLNTGSSCMSFDEAYKKAATECGQVCSTPTATPNTTTGPRPSTTPTASSTSVPTPRPSLTPMPSPVSSTAPLSFSCRVRAFKLKASDVTGTPLQFATPDREVDISSNRVAPGERYALLVESGSNSGMNVATISATTNNLHGFDEPFLIKATSPYCSSYKDRYVSCTNPGTYISNPAKIIDQGMVVEIQPEITQLFNASTQFHVNYIQPGWSSSADCGVMMLAVEPTPPPTCNVVSTVCLKGLLGGTCPTRTVCTTPSPTPTPTPDVCAQEYGSCVSKTGNCMTYADSCVKSSECAAPFTGCKPLPSTSPIPAGCRYEQVQCVKAPCNPILVCATPPATVKPTSIPHPAPCLKILGRSFCLPTFR